MCLRFTFFCLCRYPLFFRDLVKHTPDDHPNYGLISGALEAVRGTADRVNEHMRASKTAAKMFEISSMCEEVEDLMAAGRFHISTLSVTMKNERKDRHGCQLFLFNDMILILEEK